MTRSRWSWVMALRTSGRFERDPRHPVLDAVQYLVLERLVRHGVVLPVRGGRRKVCHCRARSTDSRVSTPARVSAVVSQRTAYPVVGLPGDRGYPTWWPRPARAAGALLRPPQRLAPAGRGLRAKALATTGTVRSFTIVHRAAPNRPGPYVSSVIELDGGGVVKGNIVDAGSEAEKVRARHGGAAHDLPCGLDEEGTEAVAFGFTPA